MGPGSHISSRPVWKGWDKLAGVSSVSPPLTRTALIVAVLGSHLAAEVTNQMRERVLAESLERVQFPHQSPTTGSTWKSGTAATTRASKAPKAVAHVGDTVRRAR